MSSTLVPGKYRHFKGRDYEVYDVVKHSETEELLVLYRPLYGEKSLWVRPLALFQDSVLVNGQETPRFCLIDDKAQSAGDPVS